MECPSSPHVLVGTSFEIAGATVNESQLECNFTSTPPSTNDGWTYEGGKVAHVESMYVCMYAHSSHSKCGQCFYMHAWDISHVHNCLYNTSYVDHVSSLISWYM